MTLEQLANHAGCTKGYLSIVETGKRIPSQQLLERLEHALAIPNGALRRAGAWESTPDAVKKQIARMREENAAARAITRTLRASNLDELYQSGQLRTLVERLGSIPSRPSEQPSPDRDHPPNTETHTDTTPQPTPHTPSAADNAPPPPQPASVPLVNAVQAGYPREFTDLGYPARVADEYVSVPGITDPDAFAARVVGDSMAPEYVEGDIVVFSPLVDAADGTDCFVRLARDDETTFKRVFVEQTTRNDVICGSTAAHENGDAHGEGDPDGRDAADGGPARIRLQPLNPRYSPRLVDREDIAGMYRAVCVIRRVRGPAFGGASRGA